MSRNNVKSLLLLAGSLALFVMVGLVHGSVLDILLLVLVLLIHESGHLLAMKFFGGKDVRMLFIPMLGALVTGDNREVSAGQKAVISFMGPLPGILIGAGCLIAGMIYQQPLLRQYAMLSVLLNAFNLLPIMPLDGGQLLNEVFLRRSLILQVVFKASGVAALFLLSYLLNSRLLIFIAIPLGLSIRATWRLVRVVNVAKEQGYSSETDDEGLLRMFVLQAFPGIGDRESEVMARQAGEYFRQHVASMATRIATGLVYLGSLLVALMLGVVIVYMAQYSKEIVVKDDGQREFVRYFGDAVTVRASLGDGDYFNGPVVMKGETELIQALGICRNGLRDGEWLLYNEQSGNHEMTVLYKSGEVVEVRYVAKNPVEVLARNMLEEQNPTLLNSLEHYEPEHPAKYFSFR